MSKKNQPANPNPNSAARTSIVACFHCCSPFCCVQTQSQCNAIEMQVWCIKMIFHALFFSHVQASAPFASPICHLSLPFGSYISIQMLVKVFQARLRLIVIRPHLRSSYGIVALPSKPEPLLVLPLFLHLRPALIVIVIDRLC